MHSPQRPTCHARTTAPAKINVGLTARGSVVRELRTEPAGLTVTVAASVLGVSRKKAAPFTAFQPHFIITWADKMSGKSPSGAVIKALDLTEAAGDFIGRIVGPPAEQLGGLLADQIGFWRAKNLNRLAEKWFKEVDKRQIPPERLRALPFGEAFRALEAASIEEEEDVQELWANLLANAADSEQSTRIKRPYIDILKSIGSVEAKFLNILWYASHANSIDQHGIKRLGYDDLERASWSSYNEHDKATAIQNLTRLQCIACMPEAMPDPAQILRIGGPVNKKDLQDLFHFLGETFRRNADVGYRTPNDARLRERDYILTNLGLDLMKACSSPRSHAEES